MGRGRVPLGSSMLWMAARTVGLRPGCARSAFLMSATLAPVEDTWGARISAMAMIGPAAASAFLTCSAAGPLEPELPSGLAVWAPAPPEEEPPADFASLFRSP